MVENDDAETDGRGILEGSGSGGGAERVEEHRPDEEGGGSRVWLYIVIALIVIIAAFPVLRLFGITAETPTLTWVYGAVLVLALVILVPFVYGLIKKST